MPNTSPPADRGGSLLEYSIVILLVAALVGVTLSVLPGLRLSLTASLQAAACNIFNGEDCADPASPETGSSADANPADTSGDSGYDAVAQYQSQPQQQSGITEDEIRENVAEAEEMLTSTEIGQETLDFLTEQSAPHINFPVYYGEPYNYLGYSCLGRHTHIYVDASQDPEMIAGVLVHEAVHRQDDIDPDRGLPAPADFTSEDDYLEAMAEYEARAMAAEVGFIVARKLARGEDIPQPPGLLGPSSFDEAMALSEYRYVEHYQDALQGPDRESTVHAREAAQQAVVEELVPLYLNSNIGWFRNYRNNWEGRWQAGWTYDEMLDRDCDDNLPGTVVRR